MQIESHLVISKAGDQTRALETDLSAAALRALATEGIQRGHMGLHARTVALAAGATGDLVDRVAEAKRGVPCPKCNPTLLGTASAAVVRPTLTRPKPAR